MEGLVEHGLVYRSNINGESIEEAIRRETSDLSRILHETGSIDDTPKRLLTQGVATFAYGFYLFMRKEGIDEYKATIESLNRYFLYMDETYYGDLEGRVDDMERASKTT